MKLQGSHLYGRAIRQSIAKVLEIFIRLAYKRIILILAIMLCAGVTAALWNMTYLSSSLISSQAIQNATLYARALTEADKIYSNAVDRAAIVKGITVTHDYATKQGAIPLPVTFLIELSKQLSKKSPGMMARLYSDYPFPWRRVEGGVKDNFEREALSYLRQHPQLHFSRSEQFQGLPSMRYAEAVIMEPSCVACHNTHPSSPKRDWQVGDVRGVLEITTPLDTYIKRTNKGLRGTFATLAVLSLFGLFGIALVIGRLRQTSQELELRVIERTEDLRKTNEQLATEQEKSDRLLLNILPEPIAKQLKEGHSSIADGFAEVTILFADLVNFTQLSERVSPSELVELLNEIFSAFDCLTEKYHLEKIKTIGDAYMVAGGIPIALPNHAEGVAQMALDMQQEITQFNARHDTALSIRIGINTGPVVAGVLGTKKFIYDLWGDTVNVASRMESHGLAGKIQVTATTYERLRSQYNFEQRGPIQVKGKGEMITYILIGRKSEVLSQ